MSRTKVHQSFVTIARLVRARGNRGEVVAEDVSDNGGRFSRGSRVFLLDSSQQRREAVLERAWHHKGRLILKFQGIDSIADAEALRGCEVQLPWTKLGPPAEGHYYSGDLVGCKVIEAERGRMIGVVGEVLDLRGGPLLQVQSGEREILIPFASSICVDIAPARGEIVVRLPEGLEELNP